MKTILLFLLPLISFGQITYENGTQDLKKLIVMQTLLAENRVDDLSDFMLNNNYVAVADNLYIDTSTYKLDKGDVFPFFFISDVPSEQASRMSMANKYISVWFSRVLHDWDTPDAISKNIMYASKLDLRESNLIFGQVFGIVAPIVGSMSFDGGYVPFTHLGAMSGMCEDQNYNCEQIDRYTLKTYDIEKDEEKTFTATNFLNANGLIQSSEEFSNNILFYGPGEYGATLLTYSNNEMKKSETGEAQYSIKLALKSMKRTARNNINVDFFMALKNFNDRIWTDKKF